MLKQKPAESPEAFAKRKEHAKADYDEWMTHPVDGGRLEMTLAIISANGEFKKPVEQLLQANTSTPKNPVKLNLDGHGLLPDKKGDDIAFLEANVRAAFFLNVVTEPTQLADRKLEVDKYRSPSGVALLTLRANGTLDDASFEKLAKDKELQRKIVEAVKQGIERAKQNLPAVRSLHDNIAHPPAIPLAPRNTTPPAGPRGSRGVNVRPTGHWESGPFFGNAAIRSRPRWVLDSPAATSPQPVLTAQAGTTTISPPPSSGENPLTDAPFNLRDPRDMGRLMSWNEVGADTINRVSNVLKSDKFNDYFSKITQSPSGSFRTNLAKVYLQMNETDASNKSLYKAMGQLRFYADRYLDPPKMEQLLTNRLNLLANLEKIHGSVDAARLYYQDFFKQLKVHVESGGEINLYDSEKLIYVETQTAESRLKGVEPSPSLTEQWSEDFDLVFFEGVLDQDLEILKSQGLDSASSELTAIQNALQTHQQLLTVLSDYPVSHEIQDADQQLYQRNYIRNIHERLPNATGKLDRLLTQNFQVRYLMGVAQYWLDVMNPKTTPREALKTLDDVRTDVKNRRALWSSYEKSWKGFIALSNRQASELASRQASIFNLGPFSISGSKKGMNQADYDAFFKYTRDIQELAKSSPEINRDLTFDELMFWYFSPGNFAWDRYLPVRSIPSYLLEQDPSVIAQWRIQQTFEHIVPNRENVEYRHYLSVNPTQEKIRRFIGDGQKSLGHIISDATVQHLIPLINNRNIAEESRQTASSFDFIQPSQNALTDLLLNKIPLNKADMTSPENQKLFMRHRLLIREPQLTLSAVEENLIKTGKPAKFVTRLNQQSENKLMDEQVAFWAGQLEQAKIPAPELKALILNSKVLAKDLKGSYEIDPDMSGILNFVRSGQIDGAEKNLRTGTLAVSDALLVRWMTRLAGKETAPVLDPSIKNPIRILQSLEAQFKLALAPAERDVFRNLLNEQKLSAHDLAILFSDIQFAQTQLKAAFPATNYTVANLLPVVAFAYRPILIQADLIPANAPKTKNQAVIADKIVNTQTFDAQQNTKLRLDIYYSLEKEGKTEQQVVTEREKPIQKGAETKIGTLTLLNTTALYFTGLLVFLTALASYFWIRLRRTAAPKEDIFNTNQFPRTQPLLENGGISDKPRPKGLPLKLLFQIIVVLASMIGIPWWILSAIDLANSSTFTIVATLLLSGFLAMAPGKVLTDLILTLKSKRHSYNKVNLPGNEVPDTHTTALFQPSMSGSLDDFKKVPLRNMEDMLRNNPGENIIGVMYATANISQEEAAIQERAVRELAQRLGRRIYYFHRNWAYSTVNLEKKYGGIMLAAMFLRFGTQKPISSRMGYPGRHYNYNVPKYAGFASAISGGIAFGLANWGLLPIFTSPALAALAVAITVAFLVNFFGHLFFSGTTRRMIDIPSNIDIEQKIKGDGGNIESMPLQDLMDQLPYFDYAGGSDLGRIGFNAEPDQVFNVTNMDHLKLDPAKQKSRIWSFFFMDDKNRMGYNLYKNIEKMFKDKKLTKMPEDAVLEIRNHVHAELQSVFDGLQRIGALTPEDVRDYKTRMKPASGALDVKYLQDLYASLFRLQESSNHFPHLIKRFLDLKTELSSAEKSRDDELKSSTPNTPSALNHHKKAIKTASELKQLGDQLQKLVEEHYFPQISDETRKAIQTEAGQKGGPLSKDEENAIKAARLQHYRITIIPNAITNLLQEESRQLGSSSVAREIAESGRIASTAIENLSTQIHQTLEEHHLVTTLQDYRHYEVVKEAVAVGAHPSNKYATVVTPDIEVLNEEENSVDSQNAATAQKNGYFHGISLSEVTDNNQIFYGKTLYILDNALLGAEVPIRGAKLPFLFAIGSFLTAGLFVSIAFFYFPNLIGFAAFIGWVVGALFFGQFEAPYNKTGIGAISFGDPSHDYAEPNGPFFAKSIFEEANKNQDERNTRNFRWGRSDVFYRVLFLFAPGIPLSVRWNTLWGTVGYYTEPVMFLFLTLGVILMPLSSSIADRIYPVLRLLEFSNPVTTLLAFGVVVAVMVLGTKAWQTFRAWLLNDYNNFRLGVPTKSEIFRELWHSTMVNQNNAPWGTQQFFTNYLWRGIAQGFHPTVRSDLPNQNKRFANGLVVFPFINALILGYLAFYSPLALSSRILIGLGTILVSAHILHRTKGRYIPLGWNFISFVNAALIAGFAIVPLILVFDPTTSFGFLIKISAFVMRFIAQRIGAADTISATLENDWAQHLFNATMPGIPNWFMLAGFLTWFIYSKFSHWIFTNLMDKSSGVLHDAQPWTTFVAGSSIKELTLFKSAHMITFSTVFSIIPSISAVFFYTSMLSFFWGFAPMLAFTLGFYYLWKNSKIFKHGEDSVKLGVWGRFKKRYENDKKLLKDLIDKFDGIKKANGAIDTAQKKIVIYLEELDRNTQASIKREFGIPDFSLPDIEAVRKKLVEEEGDIYVFQKDGRRIYSRDQEFAVKRIRALLKTIQAQTTKLRQEEINLAIAQIAPARNRFFMYGMFTGIALFTGYLITALYTGIIHLHHLGGAFALHSFLSVGAFLWIIPVLGLIASLIPYLYKREFILNFRRNSRNGLLTLVKDMNFDHKLEKVIPMRSELRSNDLASQINQMPALELRNRIRELFAQRKIVSTHFYSHQGADGAKKNVTRIGGVLLLRKINGAWSFVVGQRKDSNIQPDEDAGQWAFPAGAIKRGMGDDDSRYETPEEIKYLYELGILREGDFDKPNERITTESLAGGAAREIFEELGIHLRIRDFIGRIDDFSGSTPGQSTLNENIVVSLMVYVDDSVESHIPASPELENISWVPLAVVLKSAPSRVGPDVETYFSKKLKRRITFMAGARLQGMAAIRTFFNQVNKPNNDLDQDKNTLEIVSSWPPAVTFIGAHRIKPENPLYQSALQAGKKIAELNRQDSGGQKFTARSGGYGGVMEAGPRGFIQGRGAEKSAFETQAATTNIPGLEVRTNGSIEKQSKLNSFVTRKTALGINASWFVWPGGLGTIDEILFAQHHGIPMAAFSSNFWNPISQVMEIALNSSSRSWYKKPLTLDDANAITPTLLRSLGNPSDLSSQFDPVEIETAQEALNRLLPAIVLVGNPMTEDNLSDALIIARKILIGLNLPIRFVANPEFVQTALSITADEEVKRQIERRPLIQAVVSSPAHDSSQVHGQIFEPNTTQLLADIINLKSALSGEAVIGTNATAYVFFPNDPESVYYFFNLAAQMMRGVIQKKPIILVGKNFWTPIIATVAKQLLTLEKGAYISDVEFLNNLVKDWIIDPHEENSTENNSGNIISALTRALRSFELGKAFGSSGKFYQDLFSQYRRLQTNHLSYSSNPEIEMLERVAAIFGIDEGLDRERHAKIRRILLLIDQPRYDSIRQDLFADILTQLSKTSWHATGAHRFTPIALAIVNMLNGKNLFDPEAINSLIRIDARFLYLKKMHHLYADPFDVGHDWQSHIPKLTIPFAVEPGEKLKILDVGTAPKENGSPSLVTLQTLNQLLPNVKMKLTGIDNFFPTWSISNGGEIMASPFRNITLQPRARLEKDGIFYWDTTPPENDPMSETFMGDEPTERFHIITLSMILHLLRRKGDQVKPSPMTIDPGIHWRTGFDIKIVPAPEYHLTSSQQEVLQNLLRRLKLGGVMFLNMPWGSEYYKDGNTDLFLIVRRETETDYRLYDEAIPFRPNYRYFDSSEFLLTSFAGGYLSPVYSNMGLQTLFPLIDSKKLLDLLRRADKAAYGFQRRNHSIWNRIAETAQKINSHAPLHRILEVYLEDVPVSDPRKALLIKEATELESSSARSELRHGSLKSSALGRALKSTGQQLRVGIQLRQNLAEGRDPEAVAHVIDKEFSSFAATALELKPVITQIDGSLLVMKIDARAFEGEQAEQQIQKLKSVLTQTRVLLYMDSKITLGNTFAKVRSLLLTDKELRSAEQSGRLLMPLFDSQHTVLDYLAIFKTQYGIPDNQVMQLIEDSVFQKIEFKIRNAAYLSAAELSLGRIVILADQAIFSQSQIRTMELSLLLGHFLDQEQIRRQLEVSA
ncbi:MAG: hypothetical protein EXS63_07910 [Candidatus Omnitrophica bacterium]|nr:hypothetical protein [Candidatus Omnitrophota bacterium]